LQFLHHDDPTHYKICTLSLHDALPISGLAQAMAKTDATEFIPDLKHMLFAKDATLTAKDRSEIRVIILRAERSKFLSYHDMLVRSEEHTSELQSRENIVCSLLLEKKKT